MRLILPLPDTLSRTASRHRRVIAALLAAAATVLGLTTLRPSAAPTAEGIPPAPVTARSGEVMVPVLLDDPALLATVQPGDEIDLVSVDPQGRAAVVADRARVVDRGGSAPTLGGPRAVLLVAVPEAAALDLSAASLTTRLSLMIHPVSGR